MIPFEDEEASYEQCFKLEEQVADNFVKEAEREVDEDAEDMEYLLIQEITHHLFCFTSYEKVDIGLEVYKNNNITVELYSVRKNDDYGLDMSYVIRREGQIVKGFDKTFSSFVMAKIVADKLSERIR